MPGKTKKDLAASLVSQVGFKLIGFLIVALLARYLDKEDYGRLTMSISLCAAAVLLTDLGLSSDLVRKVAVMPSRIQSILSITIATRLPLLALFILATNLVIAFVKPDLLPVVLGISIYTALKDLYRTYSSAFTALRQIELSILSFASGLFVTLVGIALSVYFELPRSFIIASYIAGGFVMLAVGVYLFHRMHGPIQLPVSWHTTRTNTFNAIGLFALSGLSYLHFALDTISLGFLSTYDDVANYEVASRLYEASQFVIRPITLIMFPISAKLVAEAAWTRFQGLLNKMFFAAFGIGVSAWVVSLLAAEPIMTFIYSESFVDSAPIMQLLYAATPFLFLATVGLFVSASQNRESFACVVVLLAIFVKLVANLWIIPNYGPTGAAAVNLTTQAAIAIVLCIDAYRSIFRAKRVSTPTHS